MRFQPKRFGADELIGCPVCTPELRHENLNQIRFGNLVKIVGADTYGQ